ncbi:MAG: DNA internalization-related competence protein ComEC/Rec2 [Chloroflexi bacterium]|nr:DNA internalization-related competence protein ComEC/Rec2 [Chloroflexota bacterium]
MIKLTLLTIAWLIGIALSHWLNPSLSAVLVLFPAPLALIALWRDRRSVQRLGVYALALLAGAAWVQLRAPRIDAGHVAFYNDTGVVVVRGVVESDPELGDTTLSMRVRAVELERADGARPVQGSVWVQASRYPGYAYGDQVVLRGRLETPPELAEFSYKDYLARQGLHALMRHPEITVTGEGQSSPFYARLYAWRARARETIAAILPEPEASLLAGILLGLDSGIPEETMDAFTATGTVHIIVISGFNLTLLAGLLVRVGTRFFNRMRVLWGACAGVILYALFVGAGPPVVRAAAMSCLTLLAYLVGRPYSVDSALAFAVLVMTVLNPLSLWDVSLQLSVGATLGLLVVAPLAASRARRALEARIAADALPWTMGTLNELFIASLAAQFATLPIIAYHFGRISLISPLTNLLILPAQPGVMISGGVATLAGLLWEPLGRILGWAPWLLLTYTTRVVAWTARPAWAAVEVQLAPWAALAIYALPFLPGWLRQAWQPAAQQLAALTRFLRERPGVNLAGLALLAAGALTWIAVLELPDGRLHIHVLDVGQGDAILLELPQGQQVLIDGGPEPSRLLPALGRRMPFWDRRIEMVILTHADMDHLAGLIPVLERYRVERIVAGPSAKDNPAMARWEALLAVESGELIRAQRGLQFVWSEGLRMEVLHPPAQPAPEEDENANSVVLRLAYGELSALFTGDAEADVEAQLVADGLARPSQVLKVSHHGASEATSAAFLQAVQPQVAVISVGAENRHGHPAADTLRRLEALAIRVLRTDRQGAVEIISDGVHYAIETGR